eukprot:6271193-Pyramimonas_sp.AAC.1
MSVPDSPVGRWWCLVSLLPLSDVAIWAVKILASAVKLTAAQLAEKDMKHRASEFRKWVTSQAGNGAGGLFAITREKVPWSPCAPDKERAHLPVHKQREMSMLQAEWSRWWK